MASSGIFAVRIVGLGPDGCRLASAVARAVRDLWPHVGLAVETACADDDRRLALRTVRRWCDRERVAAVLTVGRGGYRREDFAPEMTSALLDRPLPGVEERMCLASARSPHDLLFRGRAGMRQGTLIVNLPDRERRARAIVRFLGPVVQHAVEKARGSDRECVATEGRR